MDSLHLAYESLQLCRRYPLGTRWNTPERTQIGPHSLITSSRNLFNCQCSNNMDVTPHTAPLKPP